MRGFNPLEAEVLDAFAVWAEGDPEDQTAARLARALEQYRTNPWPDPDLMRDALRLAGHVAESKPHHVARVSDALALPFAASLQEQIRRNTALAVAMNASDTASTERTVKALEAFEPWVPWDESFLRERVRIYAGARNPRALKAAEDFAEWSAHRPTRLDDLLRPAAD